ncbi:MAG: GYD domain-containing protein [Deltaproteobacteria bacterium]|nr:GYD domain-containing protein [Deltaproteobacteria bacterium]
MATYIVLVNFTDQGIRNIKQTTERAKAVTAAAQRLGIKVNDIYWTMGMCDVVLVADAPNDEAITAWTLGAGSLGNIRTQTMRAFSADELNKILAKIP